MRIKTVLYWLSVVRPIADIVIGAIKGVIGAIQQIKSDEQLQKERDQIVVDHALPDLDESDFLNISKGEIENGK